MGAGAALAAGGAGAAPAAGGAASDLLVDAVFALSSVLAAALVLLYLRTVPARGKGAVAAATLVYTAAFVVLRMGLQLPVLLQEALLAGVTCVYVRATRRAAWPASLLLATVFVLVLDMGDVLVLALSALARAAGALPADPFAAFLAMRAATLAVDLAAAAALSGRVGVFAGEPHVSDALLLALPVATFVLFRTSFTEVLQPESAASAQTHALCALLVASTFLSLVGSTYYLAAREQRGATRELTRLLDQQRRMFELRLESDDALRCMRHDVLNQIALAEGTTDEADRLRHLAAVRERVAAPQARAHTNNAALDVVLAQKAAEAQRRGVTLDAVANLKDASFIEAVDVCAIFSNALDNAIEACAELPEGAPRRVTLRAGTVQGRLVVKVENPFAGERVPREGRFPTTKRGAGAHGIGLASIERSAARYGGSVDASSEGGRFTLAVVVPIP